MTHGDEGLSVEGLRHWQLASYLLLWLAGGLVLVWVAFHQHVYSNYSGAGVETVRLLLLTGAVFTGVTGLGVLVTSSVVLAGRRGDEDAAPKS